jgi:hypothetical protein
VQNETRPNSYSELFGLRAAQYVRMSTDFQKYSTQNQADAIVEYATRRGLYLDRGSRNEDDTIGLKALSLSVFKQSFRFSVFGFRQPIGGAIRSRVSRHANSPALPCGTGPRILLSKVLCCIVAYERISRR